MNLSIPNLKKYQSNYDSVSNTTGYRYNNLPSTNPNINSYERSVKVEEPTESVMGPSAAHGPATWNTFGQSVFGTTGNLTEQRPIKQEAPEEPSEYPRFGQLDMPKNNGQPGSGPSAHTTKSMERPIKCEVPEPRLESLTTGYRFHNLPSRHIDNNSVQMEDGQSATSKNHERSEYELDFLRFQTRLAEYYLKNFLYRLADNNSYERLEQVDIPAGVEMGPSVAQGPLATLNSYGQPRSGPAEITADRRPLKREVSDESTRYPMRQVSMLLSENIPGELGAGPVNTENSPPSIKRRRIKLEEPNGFEADKQSEETAKSSSTVVEATTEQQFMYQYTPRIDAQPNNRELEATTYHSHEFPSRHTDNNYYERSVKLEVPELVQPDPLPVNHEAPERLSEYPSFEQPDMHTSYSPAQSEPTLHSTSQAPQPIKLEAPEDPTGYSAEHDSVQLSENIHPKLTVDFGAGPVKIERSPANIERRRIELEELKGFVHRITEVTTQSRSTTIEAEVLTSSHQDDPRKKITNFKVEHPLTIKKEADQVAVKTKDPKKKKSSQKSFPLVKDYTDDLPKVRLQCHLCNTILTSENSVASHACTHANLVFFECGHCDRKFNSIRDKCRVKKHMKNKHGIIMEKGDLDKFTENKNSLKDTIEAWRKKCFPLMY